MRKGKSMALPDEEVISKICMVRGQRVMLEEDLADLYKVETRRLNEQVNRNIDRFPEDFMFQLTPLELGRNPKITFSIHRARCVDVVKHSKQRSRHSG